MGLAGVGKPPPPPSAKTSFPQDCSSNAIANAKQRPSPAQAPAKKPKNIDATYYSDGLIPCSWLAIFSFQESEKA